MNEEVEEMKQKLRELRAIVPKGCNKPSEPQNLTQFLVATTEHWIVEY